VHFIHVGSLRDILKKEMNCRFEYKGGQCIELLGDYSPLKKPSVLLVWKLHMI
jgi:hypothetical protein